MEENALWTRLSLGAVAGLVATLILQSARSSQERWLPAASAPIKTDPGKFMVQQAEKALPEAAQEHVTQKAETAVGQVLGLGYGLTFGALYGAIRQGRPAPWEGPVLGLLTWAAGYLGWLPASRLMPPVWKQKQKQIWAPLAEHVLYGVATTTSYRWLQRHAPGGGEG